MCYTCSLRKINLIKSEIFRTIRNIRSVRRYEKVFETTARKHWKFPSRTFPITPDGTDYTDFAEIFRLDQIHLSKTASLTLKNNNNNNSNNNNNNNNKNNNNNIIIIILYFLFFYFFLTFPFFFLIFFFISLFILLYKIMCYTCSLRKMNLIKSVIFRTIRNIRSVRRYEKVGSLSKHDGDGSEDVICKCNFAFLQSIFSYSKSLCLKNVF